VMTTTGFDCMETAFYKGNSRRHFGARLFFLLLFSVGGALDGWRCTENVAPSLQGGRLR
jgi:hypothetical protein